MPMIKIEKKTRKQGRNAGFEPVRCQKTRKRSCETNPSESWRFNPRNAARIRRPGLKSTRSKTNWHVAIERPVRASLDRPARPERIRCETRRPVDHLEYDMC